MKKIVMVINGKGGVGKDTLCESLKTEYGVRNVSAITPVKDIAHRCGWNGEKDNKSRRFLAELKRVLVDYNDLPNTYLLSQYQDFLKDDNQFMFAHIREGDQIAHFVDTLPAPAYTLLITRADLDCNTVYGNPADDDVEAYPYDYRFDNSKPIQESKKDFLAFMKGIYDSQP